MVLVGVTSGCQAPLVSSHSKVAFPGLGKFQSSWDPSGHRFKAWERITALPLLVPLGVEEKDEKGDGEDVAIYQT